MLFAGQQGQMLVVVWIGDEAGQVDGGELQVKRRVDEGDQGQEEADEQDAERARAGEEADAAC
jgi:hypothetical protein